MLNATEERPTKVLLHGPLGDMFGREHSLYVSSPSEAIRALCVLREGFRGELSRPGAFYTVLAGETALPPEGLNIGTAGRDIHIVPVVEGAKTDNQAAGWSILAGAALIGVSIALPGAAAVAAAKVAGTLSTGMKVGAFIGGIASSFGWSMALGGVINLLSPSDTTDKPSEAPENDPSRLFSGAVNTIAQGHPIQICYGEVEVGSALISTMIEYAHKPHSDDGGGGGPRDDFGPIYIKEMDDDLRHPQLF
jgi:predicted phage tail protein